MQGEIFAIEAQLALAQISTDTATDIFRSWRAVPRRKAYVRQVGGELQALAVAQPRPVVELDILQRTLRLELLEQRQRVIRQGRKRRYQRL